MPRLAASSAAETTPGRPRVRRRSRTAPRTAAGGSPGSRTSGRPSRCGSEETSATPPARRRQPPSAHDPSVNSAHPTVPSRTRNRSRLRRQKPEEQDFIKQGAVVSVVAAAAIKFGSLALDLPFEPSYGAALALIFGPTAATGAVFALRAAAGGKEGDALAKE